MKPQLQPSPHDCRIVVGVDAVRSIRAVDSAVAVVALIKQGATGAGIEAQIAGADIVLAVADPEAPCRSQPDLDQAVQAARMIARRRRHVATTAQQASHDVAQALNVIALATEAGLSGRLDLDRATDQIADLARSAGVDAWRAGGAFRSSSQVISKVGLRSLLADDPFSRSSQANGIATVEVVEPEREVAVFADERRLVDAVAELITNAKRAGANKVRVEVLEPGDGRAELSITDDGPGFSRARRDGFGQPFNACPSSERLGLGLATVAELATELGGDLVLRDAGVSAPTHVVLSLPIVEDRMELVVSHVETVDQAAAQADVLEGVVRHVPLEESLEAIVAAIEHQLPGAVCSVLLLNDGQTLHHMAGAQLPENYRQSIDGVAIGMGQGSCGTAAFTGTSVVASDVTVDHNWTDFRDIATAHGLRSCWSTPIVAAEDGEVLGTFAVYRPTVWKPDQTAIGLVDRFTHLAAVAIEHHRLFGALAESEARFRSAFEGTAAGIGLVSLEGSFLKVNRALTDLVGRPEAQLVGTNLLDLVEPSHRNLVTGSWTEAADPRSAAHSLRSVNVALRTSNGAAPVWLSLRTSLIAGESGESERQPYLYVEVRDITAARKQLVDLRAREAAEAANQAKSDVLALVSHELRTPLNVILGFAQVMQLVDLDQPQTMQSVDQIVKAGRHLSDLINGLLDLSRIESGQLGVDVESVESLAVIGEAIELVRPLASTRQIELVNDTGDNAEHYVVADRRCMRQVLINLLDNAVKYTPAQGRVEVAVSVSPEGSSRISVTDSGPGIPADSLDDVFQPFHRLDRDAAAQRDGTGLGLALCARLMHEMGGSIGVSSKVGVGSSFWFDLPRP